jgi:hypothetical protein
VRQRFFRPTHEVETGRYLAFQKEIDRFWSRVGTEAVPAVRRGAFDEAGRLLASAISPFGGGVLAEIVAQGDPPVVIVSATGEPHLGAAADAIVALAPRLAGLAVARHRPPSSMPDVIREVQRKHGFELSRAEARCGFARGHLLEVVVYCHEFASATDGPALDAANLAVMTAIGEERFDDWIGAVDVAPAPRPGALRVMGGPRDENRFPLGELADAVERAVAGVDSERGSAPYHTYCERADWTMFDVEPAQADDYAEQDDLVHVVTMLPEMTKTFLSGARFSSRRFSCVGERFTYLKIDAEDKDPGARHELRLELEDALNYALVPGRIGCVVGAGLGLRYVYLVLALHDVDHGVELALRTAARCGVDDRAWMLFCDAVWAHEWVGIHDGLGPPWGLSE